VPSGPGAVVWQRYLRNALQIDTAAYTPWHFLYFFPLPRGQGSLRPVFWPVTAGVAEVEPSKAATAAVQQDKPLTFEVSASRKLAIGNTR
jgi:hypothetical protein